MTANVTRTISCKAWNSPAEYLSWVARCDIKGSDGTMLNPIFWKKVRGQKHPGRWGIVEHQIPSIKMLFKTMVKSHKHPGIKLLSSESKTQLINQRKENSYRKCICILCRASEQEQTYLLFPIQFPSKLVEFKVVIINCTFQPMTYIGLCLLMCGTCFLARAIVYH